jgi:predicted dehydrogenase/nucleoside-diphosphate-sugar epimerase
VTARIKVGLLGAGYILDSHAAALAAISGVETHAICDQSRARAARAATKFGIPHVLSTFEELAASDCEVVHILLPPALHIAAAKAMVEAGKSVFIEKPMGLDSTACVALCQLARDKGVALGVNHNFLFMPAYESLRVSVGAGELGRIDHVAVNWHYALPILQYGPFDSWLLAAPANVVFELGPHLCAFIIDLIGMPDVVSADAGNPLALPADQTVFRHWTALARAGATTALMSISITAGQSDRLLRVRGRGGSAQLDFGHDIVLRNLTMGGNPIFESHAVAVNAARELRLQASRARTRRLRAALAKRPDANPFDEGIFRSIRTFYSGGLLSVDPRHDGHFATEVIRLCEAIVARAQVGPPSPSSVSVNIPSAVKRPTVLVVGGTGFIGRRLVRKLIERGYGVRILTRNMRAAAIEFEGAQVELMAGSHGDAGSLSEALHGIKVIYHLAKCEGKSWQDYLDGDVTPTRVLAESALAAGVERLIYTGTIASYSSGNPREVIDNRTPVDRAIAHRNLYARSKAACEALLQDLHRSRGLPLVIVRPGIVIGTGSSPMHPGVAHFLSEIRADYWGDGTNALPFVLVDDVADALVQVLAASQVVGQTLLLCSPPLMNARDYVDAVATCMGTEIDARVRATWRYWIADFAKELAKNAVRHPNRRWPTPHDWSCRSHRARFDGQLTERLLDWHPVADRATMVARGIAEAVHWYMR